MTEENETTPRALPAAVFVPEETLKVLVKRIALLPENERREAKVILVKSGKYRASTDQVVLYQHQSRMSPPKADLIEVIICQIKDILPNFREIMGSPKSDERFIDFIKDYWDKLLELDSFVTLIVCSNLKGEQVDILVESFQFHVTLPPNSQE